MSRYLIITYLTQANGQIAESMAIAKKLKTRDLQTGSVILDFKKLEVVSASMNGVTVPKNWDSIAAYYYQHYKATIDRLFAENGYEVVVTQTADTSEEASAEVVDQTELVTQSPE